jgi:hypothetical protein
VKNQFNDVMYVPLMQEYLDSLSKLDTYIVPGFIFNRTIGILFINKNSAANIKDEFKDSTPAAISIEHTWDANTRKVAGSVKVTFDAIPDSGDIRFGLMIAEDNVKGGASYNQKSYFNTSAVYPELNGLGNSISGYEHMDVFRDTIFGGIYGNPDIIPDTPEIGKEYTTSFTYTVPDKYIDLEPNALNLKLIAFIGYYNGEILNADEKYLIDNTGINKNPQPSSEFQTVHLHHVGSKEICFNMNIAGAYELSLYSAQGKRMDIPTTSTRLSQGLNTFNLPCKNLSKGIYFFCVTGNGFTVSIPIVF